MYIYIYNYIYIRDLARGGEIHYIIYRSTVSSFNIIFEKYTPTSLPIYVRQLSCPERMQCWHIPNDTEHEGTLHCTTDRYTNDPCVLTAKQTPSRLHKSECDACSTMLPHCLICVAPHWQGKTLAESWQHFMWHVRTEHDQGATVLSVQTGQFMYWNLNRNILGGGTKIKPRRNHALHNFQRRWHDVSTCDGN